MPKMIDELITAIEPEILQMGCQNDWRSEQIVRAILKKLRYAPSKAMSLAGLRSVGAAAFLNNQLDYNLKVWEAMIDEALHND